MPASDGERDAGAQDRKRQRTGQAHAPALPCPKRAGESACLRPPVAAAAAACERLLIRRRAGGSVSLVRACWRRHIANTEERPMAVGIPASDRLR